MKVVHVHWYENLSHSEIGDHKVTVFPQQLRYNLGLKDGPYSVTQYFDTREEAAAYIVGFLEEPRRLGMVPAIRHEFGVWEFQKPTNPPK